MAWLLMSEYKEGLNQTLIGKTGGGYDMLINISNLYWILIIYMEIGDLFRTIGG
jgi:hypothetical protein